ncbi:MAG: hypothetical protein M3O77_01505, partial [Chloroflexota bacterium]|nr:hypothetical protein [Chloroflexota bacterium]
GYNEWVQVNDPGLFTEAARLNPVIQQFLAAPFSVNFAQFKSSYRESEYFIHKPSKAMAGEVEGIEGRVAGFPESPDKQRIATLVLNHEIGLAFRITRSLVVEDGAVAGQLIHKEGESSL